MSKLICTKAVRRYLLDAAARTRAHKFTRVSGDTIDLIEGHVRAYCAQYVKSAPSKGVTL